MDFACQEIDVTQVLKCSFALSKAGCSVLKEFLKQPNRVWRSDELAEITGHDLATIQRTLKHLFEREVLIRRQQNREAGGYEYVYELKEEQELITLIKSTLDEWVLQAKQEVSSFIKNPHEAKQQ